MQIQISTCHGKIQRSHCWKEAVFSRTSVLSQTSGIFHISHVLLWFADWSCSDSEKMSNLPPKKMTITAPCGNILPATPMVVTSIVGVTVIIASRTSSWRKTWCKSTFFTTSRKTSSSIQQGIVEFLRFKHLLEIKKRGLMVFGDVRTKLYILYTKFMIFMPIFHATKH